MLGEAETDRIVSQQPTDVPAEERLRANMYGLLALVLRRQPDQATLGELAALPTDDTSMGIALASLAEAARTLTHDEIDREFHDLFIGIGNSELQPYGSYYMTGFLYEKPLANLRVALAELGLARAEGAAEPEDHIAALCETMCALILGSFGVVADIAAQRRFFNEHIAPWAERFFTDLESAADARFYRSVGTIGAMFMRIESQSFEMAD